jgi:hypothetical protein
MATVIGSTHGLSKRRHHFQPLDRRQHRHRGCDDGIAVEQGGTEDAERRHQPENPRRRIRRAQRQRRQRHDAALAPVVGAHDEEDVLQRDGDRQRPEDQRQDSEDGASLSGSG